MEKLLTPEQVAEVLHVEPSTVKRWLREKKLPGVKPGKAWRVAEADLKSFLDSGDGHESPVYKNLIDSMTARGFTFREMAEALNISPMLLVYKLKGKKPFYIGEAFTIHDRLNERGEALTVDYLFRDSAAKTHRISATGVPRFEPGKAKNQKQA